MTVMVTALFLLVSLAAPVAKAEGQPFTIDATGVTVDNPDQELATASGLKYRAVVEWLQNYLGARYPEVEKMVTPEFAEKYVLDYKVGRNPGNRTVFELTGHIDAESLKRWARVMLTKNEGGNSMKPVLLVSSTVPGLTLSPGETGARLASSALIQDLLGISNNAFQKFNSHVTPFDGGLSLSQPPRTDAELKQLHDQAIAKGGNSALWFRLIPCKSCGGMRMDTFLYNLTHSRLALVRSDDLSLAPEDFSHPEKLRSALKNTGRQLQSEVDEMVSNGTLFSASHRIVVEGVDNYRAFQDLELELPRLDFINQCILKRSESKLAEFEVLTPLNIEELSQRLQQEAFGGFKLKPVRVDSQSLVMRYSK